MIGQSNNINTIQKWVENQSFPRFIIITGEKGSGKKTLAKHMSKQIGMVAYPENGVDDVRETIERAYKVNLPIAYIFADADRMSPQAKNALLKITEEPPKSAYFIVTVEDINNLPSTLKSRGAVMPMEPYTKEELREFTQNTVMLGIASNPGQINILEQIDLNVYIPFCNKVLDNIGTVSGVNAFKIAKSFKFKDEEEGYDPILFLSTISWLCLDGMIQTAGYAKNHETYEKVMKAYKDTIYCCSKYKNEMKITGVKKDSTFDMWILDMRDIWYEVNKEG